MVCMVHVSVYVTVSTQGVGKLIFGVEVALDWGQYKNVKMVSVTLKRGQGERSQNFKKQYFRQFPMQNKKFFKCLVF